MQIKTQITAIGLLIALLFSVIPMESFHHHEEVSSVCTDKSSHFDVDGFDCDLADFVLPHFTKSNTNYSFKARHYLNTKIIFMVLDLLSGIRQSIYLRGPPSVFA